MRIADIRVGERRREDYGDLDGLAESIRRFGLLHPIVLDDEGTLVAGERRLRACLSLGWTEIEATTIGLLTEAERREIELEENERRKDLSPYERSKTRADRADVAAQILKDRAANSNGFRSNSGKPGPKPKPDADDKVADLIGMPASTIGEARRHAEIADAFPVFQQPAWKQYHVLEAKDHLDKLPEADRPKAVAIIDQPAIPPQAALPILRNIVAMAAEQRAEVFRLNESDDKRDRSLALTKAADRPPMPDPRIVPLRSMVRELREMARKYPGDPATPKVRSVAEGIGDVIRTVEEGVPHANGRGRA